MDELGLGEAESRELFGEMKRRENVQGKKAGIRWHLGAGVET